MKKIGKLFKTNSGNYLIWQRKNARLLKSVYPNINENDLRGYIDSITYTPGNLWTEKGFRNIDFKSERLNISNGIRRTVGVGSEDAKATIHMFGDSRMLGIGVEDAETLPSLLQKLFNEYCLQLNVINHGVRSNVLINIYSQLTSMRTNPSDVIVIFLPDFSNTKNGIGTKKGYKEILHAIYKYCLAHGLVCMFFEWPDLRLIRNPSFLERVLQRLVYTNKKYVLIPDDITAVRYKWSYFGVIPTSHLFARPHSHGEVFWDRDHLGPNGYRVVSKFMFELICEFFDREHNSCALLKIADFERISAHEHFIQHNRNLEEALTYYTKSHFIFKMKEGEIAGCVVMNCNPFSFGHKFLIDYALSKVDYLYIFVVEEDKSFFSFEHRLYLLHNHYKNNNNIKVIPSGRLILSSLTFPTYFDKDNKKEGEADLLLDINIFCTIIKSIFNISYRFVGTEPYCNVTRQYNSALRETLPKYGIEYCEIERKDIDGIPISATNIRQYIKIKDFTALQKLVPKVTFDLIKTLYAK